MNALIFKLVFKNLQIIFYKIIGNQERLRIAEIERNGIILKSYALTSSNIDICPAISDAELEALHNDMEREIMQMADEIYKKQMEAE